MTRSELGSKNTRVLANSCLLIIHSSKHHLADASVVTIASKVKSLLAISGRREKPSLFVAGNGVNSSQRLQVNLIWWRLRQWSYSADCFTGMQTILVSSGPALRNFIFFLFQVAPCSWFITNVDTQTIKQGEGNQSSTTIAILWLFKKELPNPEPR